MDHYVLWCDAKEGVHGNELAAALAGYLNHLKELGGLEDFKILRRKFGFGPEGLGEFCISIGCRDLAQLDLAFQHVAPRTDRTEDLHRAVFSRVHNMKTALYRDFPDVFPA